MKFFDPDKLQRNIRVASLPEWLDWAAGNSPEEWRVTLPMIQRGFVWKPHQILALWDTLLRGLPIGALMVSELPVGARSVALFQQKLNGAGSTHGQLGLIDGQQRTLAMLAGWPLPKGTSYSHRVWVDFADTPYPGELLRLRITTRNQPFGYCRDNPSVKLSQADRRDARNAWKSPNLGPNGSGEPLKDAALPDFLETKPYSRKPTLALDLRALLCRWRDLNGEPEPWMAWLTAELLQLWGETVATSGSPTACEEKAGRRLPDEVQRRVELMVNGLSRLHEAEIALVRVDDSFFSAEVAKGTDAETEPPLALLFKRIGANATKLSDEDYVYSILKHLLPEVHDLVTALHDRQRSSVAALLNATDLVMSALRLAAVGGKSLGREPSDPESPSKDDFHRLIKRERFLQDSLLPLLQDGQMGRWFDLVLGCLDYRASQADGVLDPGLPRHALPHLTRPLVQVLLRLAQAGYLAKEGNTAARNDVLRLTMYWWLCVTDHHKASRLAYQAIATYESEGLTRSSNRLGLQIMQAIVEGSAGHPLQTKTDLLARPGLVMTARSETNGPLRGWSRFAAEPDSDRDHSLCEFWKRWCAPHTHRHPVLLWLQRRYVSTMPGDPIAGRDEDTPYDYDHILPQNDWGNWTGSGQRSDKFTDHCKVRHEAYVIGNCIGNVRAWLSSDNRSDGDASPLVKLQRAEEIPAPVVAAGRSILDDSGISEADAGRFYAACIPKPDPRTARPGWTFERAKAFEEAVENRSWSLYERFYDELGFSLWTQPSNA